MSILAISDLHGTLPDLPYSDLLIIGGDITPVWNHERQYQAEWLRSDFTDWLDKLNERGTDIIGVGGNHDFVLESSDIGYELPWLYLQDEGATVPYFGDGARTSLKVWGSPMSNKYGGWAFMDTEEALRDLWGTIPRDIDILITHGPAWGAGDEVRGFSSTKRGMAAPEHVGSRSLCNMLSYEDWPNLRAHICGHIHEGYGVSRPYKNSKIVVYNVAHMNDEYLPMNPPIEIK